MSRSKCHVDPKRESIRERVKLQAIQNGEDAIGTPAWLNNNDTFDHARTLVDDEAARRSEKLLELLMEGSIKRRREWDQKKIDIEILCANLLANKSCVLVTKKPLAISLNRNHYAPSRYTRASYFIIKLVKLMDEGGWIERAKGNQKMQRMTRIWPTRKLNDYFTPFDQVDFKPLELVNLRDEEGQLCSYSETKETEQIRNILRNANLVNREALVQLKTNRGFQQLNTDLYSVFNNRSFDLGGRLYTGKGGYQSYTKEERDQILINHKHTVELDFSGMQPRLLYALERIQYPEDADPYMAVIAGNQDLRPFAKQLLLALLNAKSLSKAIASGNYSLHLDHDLYRTLQKIGTRTAELVERFKLVHPDIAKYFGTSMGLKLMRLDAQIALEIVERFTSRNIAILAIHDSFIVEESRKDDLMKVMEEAYSKHTGGFTCPIKRENCS